MDVITAGFELQTVDEVLWEMETEGYTDFMIDGVVAASVTTVQGDSYLGKTYLALDMARSLLTGEPFLNRQVTRQADGVAFLSTDPGGKYEMAKRVRDAGIDRSRVTLKSFYAPQDWEDWKNALKVMNELGTDVLVVVDNTTDLAIDANGPREVKLITDGLRMWSDNGLHVVNIHHLNKGHVYGRSGFGSILWRKWSRAELTLTGKERTPYRKLVAVPNNAPAIEWGLNFDPSSSPAFSVRSETDTMKAERQRTKDRLDKHAAIARWIVTNCQGVTNVSEVARRLAGKFGGSAGHHRNQLMKLAYPVQLADGWWSMTV